MAGESCPNSFHGGDCEATAPLAFGSAALLRALKEVNTMSILWIIVVILLVLLVVGALTGRL